MYVCMYVCMTVLKTTTDSIETSFKGESKSVLLRHLNIGCLPFAPCVFRTRDQKISGGLH